MCFLSILEECQGRGKAYKKLCLLDLEPCRVEYSRVLSSLDFGIFQIWFQIVAVGADTSDVILSVTQLTSFDNKFKQLWPRGGMRIKGECNDLTHINTKH